MTGGAATCQTVTLKKDTIYCNKAPYAIFKKAKTQPRYFVCDLKGAELMEVHNGRVALGGQPGYVVNFLNDMRQAMIAKDAHFPMSFIRQVVAANLITNSASINANAQTAFIAAHPLPDGYTDVEQLIEF
jgi:hypothetical protein